MTRQTISLSLAAASALAAGVAFVAVGCGGDSAQSAGTVPAAGPPTESPPPTSTVPSGPQSYRVWLTRGDGLFPVVRHGPSTQSVGAEGIRLLLAGPSSAESSAGVSTQIPTPTRLLGLDITDGTATVDLTSEFEAGGGSLSMTARLAQLVYTLTEFDTVRRVRFRLDGRPVQVFSGQGIVLDRPVGRKEYDELLPLIALDRPAISEAVSSPVRISGTANVFEANVTVRILDRNGAELARDFTTATCGTGCRGTFSMELPYRSASDQAGTIVVSDDDADGDGRPQHSVAIPVRLSRA